MNGVFVTALWVLLITCAPALAADNLRLRDGISFYQDLDTGFPIIAENIEDVKIDSSHPTLIFFGAAGDLNTNRQARRLVELYKHYKDSGIKFVVIDVDHAASPDARQLLQDYYSGYIPFQVLFTKNGKKAWSQIGEIDTKVVQGQIDNLLK